MFDHRVMRASRVSIRWMRLQARGLWTPNLWFLGLLLPVEELPITDFVGLLIFVQGIHV